MDRYRADYTPPPWVAVHADVVRFDHKALRRAVEETLARDPSDEALWAATRAVVGPWFGMECWWIGNESFGGCWCHSPMATLRKSGRGRAAARDWVVQEVVLLVDAVRALGPLFEALREEPDTARAIVRGFDGLVDEMAERTQCNESWYRFVVACVPWLFDALGVPRGAELDRLLARTTACVFSSWTRPSPDAARAMAHELAAYGAAQRDQPAPTPFAPPRVALDLPRLLVPARPRRAEAEAALTGVSDAEGIAALAARGLVPQAWSHAPPRFARLNARTEVEPLRGPPPRRLLVALGADPEGIAAAVETLADYDRALAAWSGDDAAGGDPVWCDATLPQGWAARRCLGHDPALDAALAWVEALCGLPQHGISPAAALDIPALAAMLGVPAPEAAALRGLCHEARSTVHQQLFAAKSPLDLDHDTVTRVWAAACCWDVLRLLDLRYDHARTVSAAPRRREHLARWALHDGAPMRTVPMPLAPLLALWRLGYPIRARMGRGYVLGVAPLDPPLTSPAG